LMKGHVLFVFGAQACIPEDALSAAKEMGLRVSVIAPHAPCGEATALVDRLECRSVARADEAINTALAIHHEQRIDGVLAYDDQAVPVVARIAAALGLPGHPVVAADAARDKFLMKERFTAAGIPIAAYALVEDEKAALKWADGTGYPVVVKPVRGSASQGVIRADNEEELQNAYRRLRRIVREFRLDTGRRSDAEQLIPVSVKKYEANLRSWPYGPPLHWGCATEPHTASCV
jgi:biotin carboxylase